MTHDCLEQAEQRYEQRVENANNGRKGDKPGVRDALNTWLFRGATITQAVELVYSSACDGRPLI